ncbi:hypothetical protein NDU88_007590 [Pleurodeles waltl]|uniref:Uncharacterized protein n=1 Tax=Pleurodeles waltl TaxID=8319 RepID=A0AAV7NXU2_PLEWA|nr:hypothetical protein NDU88_007590 [Pleurodeles waltl]
MEYDVLCASSGLPRPKGAHTVGARAPIAILGALTDISRTSGTFEELRCPPFPYPQLRSEWRVDGDKPYPNNALEPIRYSVAYEPFDHHTCA